MRPPRRSSDSGRRALTGVALTFSLALLAGCSTWKPVPATTPLAGAPAQRFENKIRVTLKSGEQAEVESATLDADSLRGVRVDKKAASTMSAPSDESRSRYAVASTEIAKIEQSQPDRKRTKTFVFAAIGILVLIAVATVIGDD
jgi:hypothetical protein